MALRPRFHATSGLTVNRCIPIIPEIDLHSFSFSSNGGRRRGNKDFERLLGFVMVEYRVLSTFVSRRLNTDLKDFTFDLWKKRGTMKTVKICSGNIDLREVNIDLIGLREVNIDLREVRFIAPRLYRMCYTGTIVHMESLFASIKTYNLAGTFLIIDLSVISFIYQLMTSTYRRLT